MGPAHAVSSIRHRKEEANSKKCWIYGNQMVEYHDMVLEENEEQWLADDST